MVCFLFYTEVIQEGVIRAKGKTTKGWHQYFYPQPHCQHYIQKTNNVLYCCSNNSRSGNDSIKPVVVSNNFERKNSNSIYQKKNFSSERSFLPKSRRTCPSPTSKQSNGLSVSVSILQPYVWHYVCYSLVSEVLLLQALYSLYNLKSIILLPVLKIDNRI